MIPDEVQLTECADTIPDCGCTDAEREQLIRDSFLSREQVRAMRGDRVLFLLQVARDRADETREDFDAPF